MKFQTNIKNCKDDVVNSIREAVKIKSVEEPALEGKPFGKGPARALEYFLQLGENLGFQVENFDNYAGHIDFGTGEEILGILGHVDVVPEGEGWDYPPFSGELADGKIYGRGVLDNKGPMIVCLYAMKILKDSGVKFNKKIRMILGANEESGWECMKYYFDTLKMPQPDLAFTPDSAFPVTFAEKGILQVVLKKTYENAGDIKLIGGNAFNSVAEKAVLEFPPEIEDDIRSHIENFNKDKVYKITLDKKGDRNILISHGKSSHGSRPDIGYNAVSSLMTFLSETGIKEGVLGEITDFFAQCIKMEYNGQSIGVAFEDSDSGKLTLNVGMISFEKEELEISLDIRYPVTIKKEKVISGINKKISPFGLFLEEIGGKGPLYVPKDHFLVTTLMNVYKEITGDRDAVPEAIGGGTYARAVTNGVAFGALLKDQEDNMHQRNEYLEIEKLETWLRIYVEAIYRLAK